MVELAGVWTWNNFGSWQSHYSLWLLRIRTVPPRLCTTFETDGITRGQPACNESLLIDIWKNVRPVTFSGKGMLKQGSISYTKLIMGILKRDNFEGVFVGGDKGANRVGLGVEGRGIVLLPAAALGLVIFTRLPMMLDRWPNVDSSEFSGFLNKDRWRASGSKAMVCGGFLTLVFPSYWIQVIRSGWKRENSRIVQFLVPIEASWLG